MKFSWLPNMVFAFERMWNGRLKLCQYMGSKPCVANDEERMHFSVMISTLSFRSEICHLVIDTSDVDCKIHLYDA